MPLLSIILPIYNAEPWLQKCLVSIIESVNADIDNIEVIMINDGSSDNSEKICFEYASHHSNFLLYSKPNGGVASARNAGLQRAKGEYIAWVDPDDYVAKDWYSDIKNAISECSPDVVVFDVTKVQDDCPIVKTSYGRNNGLVDFEVFYEDVIRDYRILGGLPDKVIKSVFFKNIIFNDTLTIMEDYDKLPEIIKNAKSVFYIPKHLYVYRQHNFSLLHCIDEKAAFESVKIALKRLDNIDIRYKNAATASVMLQAFYYYRNYYLYENFKHEKQHIKFCREYIRKNIYILTKDNELPKILRLKIALSGLGIFGFFVNIRNRSHRGI